MSTSSVTMPSRGFAAAAPAGRIVFGLSSVLFGVIALLWHDTDTWQNWSGIWALPLGSLVGQVLMVALVVGGLLLLLPRTVRPAAIILAIVFVVFALASIPAVAAAPSSWGGYDGFFELISMLSGAIAVYAATETDARRAKRLNRAARIGLGLATISFTVAQIVYPKETVVLVPTWLPPNQTFWAVLTTIAFALAAVALLINVRARFAAGLMTLMLVLFGILVWVPIVLRSPTHANWSEFTLNFLIAGGSWMVAVLKPPSS